MKKILSKIGIALLVLIILAPILLFVGITVTNDSIASRVEQELAAHPLPQDTELADSLSAAGHLVGNGNGMQYMGAILVASSLTEEELRAYYSESFDYIEVRGQTSAKIESLNGKYRFECFPETKERACYSVILWGSRGDYVSESLIPILDLDLRGH